MLKVIDLVYHYHAEYNTPAAVLEKHGPALGFAPFIKDRIRLQFVKHMNRECVEDIDGIVYAFFKSRNRFWHIPLKTHRYIKAQRPDIVIIEGLVFPLQLMMLKFKLGKNCKIIVQHHGEKPFRGIKGNCQKMADKFIDAYLFTARGNAAEWIDKGIIKNADKCREVLEASTSFARRNKEESLKRTGMTGAPNFLWVGRLDKNKDPLTVTDAFEKYLAANPHARLYMIFQYEGLLLSIKERLSGNIILQKAIVLIGEVAHEKLPDWFSAADFYISASHKEGSGYALLEAMACGCIPVVTDIPSFHKITGGDEYGSLYPPGNSDALAILLDDLQYIEINKESESVQKYFNENLGFKNIADDLFAVLNSIVQR